MQVARIESHSAVVHTATVVGHADLVTVSALRCTSATRTIIDLAHAGTPPARLEAAIDSAIRLGLSSPVVIERRLDELRGPGRWGARHLDRLLVDIGGESLLERRFLQLVREAGLPRPSTQVVQRHDGRHVARVDFLFEAAGVVVEVTGRLGHSSPADRDRDAQRRNELLDLGVPRSSTPGPTSRSGGHGWPRRCAPALAPRVLRPPRRPETRSPPCSGRLSRVKGPGSVDPRDANATRSNASVVRIT